MSEVCKVCRVPGLSLIDGICSRKCERTAREQAERRAEIAEERPCVEICREERSRGAGGCGACALCCSEQRERAELAEIERASAVERAALAEGRHEGAAEMLRLEREAHERAREERDRLQERLGTCRASIAMLAGVLDGCGVPEYKDGLALGSEDRVLDLAKDRDRLAAENEQLVGTVNAAMRDHAACEAERARLAREVERIEVEIASAYDALRKFDMGACGGSLSALARFVAALLSEHESERARLQREVEALTAERGLARRRADDLARDLERVADERDRGREALARPLPPVVVSLLTTAGTGDSYCACGRRVSDCDGSRAACGGRR